MSLMTSLSVGTSGLRTAQSGLTTTAHNLANVATEGYCRQENIDGDFAYTKIGDTHINYLQVGLGSKVSIIKQNRDAFLDKAYRLETGRESFYKVQSEAVNEIETLFGEMEGVNFQQDLSDLWSSIQELVKEPDNIVKRTALIETAKTFLYRAQDISEQIEIYQQSMNTQIQDAVRRINEIGHEIRNMNKLISKVEAGQEQANDYRDQRNVLLDELASYGSITYKEDTFGVVTINFEGIQFVSPDYVYEMEVDYVSETSNLLTAVWKTGDPVCNVEQGYSTEMDTDVGKLKSLLIARGNKTAKYTDIPEKSNAKYYNEAGEFLDGLYAQDVLTYNKTVGSSIIMSTQSGFDKLVNGVVTAINDALNPNGDVDTVLSKLGLSTAADTVTYTVTRKVGLTTVTETFTKNLADIQIWDEYTSAIGMDEDSTPREELFARQSVERYTQAKITVTDEAGNTYEKDIWIYNEEDPENVYSLYTIEQLVINKDILENPSKLPITGNTYKGNPDAYDVETCERLVEIWNQNFATLNPNILTEDTFMSFYSSLIGDIALRGSEFSSMQSNQKTLADSIDDSRQQVSGVSSDEELTKMIQYQYAFNANSRYITTVNAMLEHLLTSLG